MITLREEVGRAAESMNKVSSTLALNKEVVTKEMSDVIGRIQDDLCHLFDILPEDIKVEVSNMGPITFAMAKER